jgi:hypothetical protein
MRLFTTALAVLLLLVAIAVAVRLFKWRQAREMKYDIISLYEGAEKPFPSRCSSISNDAEAGAESDALLVSAGSAPRPPKKREKTKELLGVDTDDVNAVQALIKQELEEV